MLEPKFEVGAKVLHKRSGRVLTVLDRKYNPAVNTYSMNLRVGGGVDVAPYQMKEYWSYKLNDGKSWRYMEELLEEVGL